PVGGGGLGKSVFLVVTQKRPDSPIHLANPVQTSLGCFSGGNLARGQLFSKLGDRQLIEHAIMRIASRFSPALPLLSFWSIRFSIYQARFEGPCGGPRRKRLASSWPLHPQLPSKHLRRRLLLPRSWRASRERWPSERIEPPQSPTASP